MNVTPARKARFMMTKNKDKSEITKGKKPYHKPKLTSFGSVRDFTQTVSTGTGMDGGTSPKNKMSCIAEAPFIEEHRYLISDRVCQDTYREAIFKTVKPGDVVVDLGTGSGIHSFFACQAGARKVYAVESGSIIAATRAAARMNGFEDRIEFISGLSTEIDLPEKADVIISNIGYLNTLICMPDGARRFLKPGGALIPNRVQNFFVPVDHWAYYAEHVDFWRQKHYGLDFSAFEDMAINGSHVQKSNVEDYLSAPQGAPSFDMRAPTEKSARWSFEFVSNKSGTMNGLLTWYSFFLIGDLNITTQPPLNLSRDVWSQPFLPLAGPVNVKKGDLISVEISYFREEVMESPIWTWRVSVNGGEAQEQSTFKGLPMSLN
jgi:SAM-dependent methyltransferase